jgi:indolepyruvate ferredoxin oxidoreductase beta subunit
MHPRLEEICGTLPAGLGRWLENSKSFGGFVERRLGHGRRMQSGTLGGFLMLYTLAGMRRFRRSTLRHQAEAAGLAQWLDLIARLVPRDYALAVETVNCRRLVKGYSDTHVRGGGKYRQLIAAAEQLAGRPDAAETLRSLRETALANEKCGPMERQLAEKLAA